MLRTQYLHIRLKSKTCGFQKLRTGQVQQRITFRRTFTLSADQEMKRPVGRRYVVVCDGTWLNSDMGFEKPLFGAVRAQTPTNVTRIARAIKHADGPIEQIVYYQRGVGTDGSGLGGKLTGGILGNGISEHIREAYSFLANNFDPETQADLNDESKPLDEICLLGFSRGAFTARAISSIISDVGLLTRKGMENFWGIFEDWKNQDVEGQESKWFQATYGEKIAFTDKRYRQTLIDGGLTRWGMPIKAVGVWDTVGALGIPLPWKEENVKNYSFVNTKVAQNVQYAFHAVALDEHDYLFTPTLWEQPDHPHMLKGLKQCWFPGQHSNIGGGYPDAGISNITLAWMVGQFEDTDGGILAFNPEYLDFVQDHNTEWYASIPEPTRPWGMGRLYNPAPNALLVETIDRLLPAIRTPGRYFTTSTVDGKQTEQRLKGTGECIHRCVRVRMNGGGLGIEDIADTSEVTRILDMVKKEVGINPNENYISEALSNFELVQPPNVLKGVDDSGNGRSGVIWRAKDGLEPLPEDEMGATEIRLLRRSVRTAHA